MDQRSPPRGPALPRDFLAEIEHELELARVGIRESYERTAQLTILYGIAVEVADALGRPITLVDFLAQSTDEIERRGRIVLVARLRCRQRQDQQSAD